MDCLRIRSTPWRTSIDMRSFCLPCGRRLRHPNSSDSNMRLIGIIQDLLAPLRICFEATCGQVWALWKQLVPVGMNREQLPTAPIRASVRFSKTRAKADRLDTKLIGRFMAFCPEAGLTFWAKTCASLKPLRLGRLRRSRCISGTWLISARE